MKMAIQNIRSKYGSLYQCVDCIYLAGLQLLLTNYFMEIYMTCEWAKIVEFQLSSYFQISISFQLRQPWDAT